MNLLSKTNKKIAGISNISIENFIFGKDETLKPKFTSILGNSYLVNVYYLKIESPKLSLEEETINVYIPYQYKIRNNQELLNTILLKMYNKIAERELELAMEKARHILGIAPEDYGIVPMASLASCDKDKKSILFNPYVVMYPREIVEYIVIHEFCHLTYKNHTKKFYDLLSKYVPNYDEIERKLSSQNY